MAFVQDVLVVIRHDGASLHLLVLNVVGGVVFFSVANDVLLGRGEAVQVEVVGRLLIVWPL